jgi:uncharacterized protein YbjT (DUF2867 family)
MIPKILVTGAAGLNGSAVVREFSRNGVAVRALVRDRSKAAALAALPYVELVEGDMARSETLDGVFGGIERALMISSADPQMVEVQRRFVDACKAEGVAHVVKFSGKESGIGFDANNFPFTRMHEEIERYLEQSGLAWTHLRPSQFMQVYLREAPTIAVKGLLRLPLDEVKLSPVDIEDIARIAFALLTQGGHQGRSFEITGPQALSMAEIAAAISEATGKSVRYQNINIEEYRRGMEAAGLPPFFVDALVEQAWKGFATPSRMLNSGRTSCLVSSQQPSRNSPNAMQRSLRGQPTEWTAAFLKMKLAFIKPRRESLDDQLHQQEIGFNS